MNLRLLWFPRLVLLYNMLWTRILCNFQPQEDQASTTSVNEPSVTAATNEQKSSNPTSASSFPPQRDWEAQFAALSSSMGFSGAVPTHPKSRKSGASKVATRTPSTSPAAQSATESPKGTSQSVSYSWCHTQACILPHIPRSNLNPWQSQTSS